MHRSFYMHLMMAGTCRNIIDALRDELETHMTMRALARKFLARKATKFLPPQPPKGFIFTPKFFTKLNMMPSVAVHVKDSRSKIRKECFGFRDKITGERVYLKLEGFSVMEFRDSPCGYLIGRRYLVPRMEAMRGGQTWPKLNRLMTRVLSEQGIIVNLRHTRAYLKSNRQRYMLANKLVRMYESMESLRTRKAKHWKNRYWKIRKEREEAKRKVP